MEVGVVSLSDDDFSLHIYTKPPHPSVVLLLSFFVLLLFFKLIFT